MAVVKALEPPGDQFGDSACCHKAVVAFQRLHEWREIGQSWRQDKVACADTVCPPWISAQVLLSRARMGPRRQSELGRVVARAAKGGHVGRSGGKRPDEVASAPGTVASQRASSTSPRISPIRAERARACVSCAWHANTPEAKHSAGYIAGRFEQTVNPMSTFALTAPPCPYANGWRLWLALSAEPKNPARCAIGVA